ncbi:hypothetical protein [Pedobacter roseus]|uniref:Uncharacterized protein n=1 Tax=Pedobacter roseus TaxID=336820 RepID=A0A7G9QKF5_9SPHI|nr:hypothetical protein [Pedobacter roseus]QNN43830.1 hypothetical protein H9L23_07030 [Pedobacter roseus]
MSKILYKPLEKPLSMLCKVEITEKTGNKEDYFFKTFSVEIFPHKTSFWSGNQNIDIVRKPISPNNLPDNNADAFAQQISAVLYQLTIKLGLNGVPSAVEKQHELWQKWLNIRENLADTFTGDWVEPALTKLDVKMLPGETLTPYIMQDIFLNEYFRNIYDAAFIGNNFYCKRTVYGLCPSPIQFNEKWLLQDSATGQSIKFSGKWDKIPDQAGFDDWLKTKTDDHLSEIRIEGLYQLDHITGWCNAIESFYTLTTNRYRKTLTITLTTN